MCTARSLAWFLPLALLALLVVPPPRARAQQPHNVYRDFEPSGKYAFYVDGKLDHEAELYQSRRAASWLVLGSRFGAPLVIAARGRAVHTFDRSQLMSQEDGGYALSDEVSFRTLGWFRMQGQDVLINVPDLTARLVPRPHLIGPVTGEEIVRHSPEHARTDARFDPGTVQWLRAQGSDVTVHVVFGSWCPTCQRYLPRILALERAVAGSRIAFDYYGLPPPPDAWTDPGFTGPRLASIPTAVVSVGGHEVGRIEAAMWEHPEVSLARLLR